jgi:hypothetical protein
MNLAEIWRIILKRWYILLPLVLVALGLTAGVDKAIAVQYQSTSMISLLASQEATKGTTALPGTENPFSNFDSSLNDTADFLTRRVNSPTDTQLLAAQGVTGVYTEALAASQGPFINLTTTGTTAASAEDQMNTLISFTQQMLATLQDQENVPAVDMIRSDVIVPASAGTALNKTKLQDTVGVGVGGLALAFLITLAAHTVLESRRRGRQPQRSARAARPAGGSEHDPVSARFDALNDPGDLVSPTEQTALLSRFPDVRD